MRIIGIDPGYGILGWSVIEDDFTVIDYGTIETSMKIPIDERVFIVYTEISSIIHQFRPDSAGIEKLFFAKNTTTALDVAKAIGVILLAFQQHALIYSEYTPAQVKQAITGYGRAEKKQMQFMIKKIFNLDEIPTPDDAADALAVAACHVMGCGRISKIMYSGD